MTLFSRLTSRAGAVFVSGILLSVAVPLLLGFLVPPSPLRDDMLKAPATDKALLGPTNYPYGFHKPETAPDGTTFRWTKSHATITFPYAANLGRYSTVKLRMASPLPSRPPARVKLSLNGMPAGEFVVPTEYELFRAQLDTQLHPNPYLESDHIQVDIESSTFQPPGDERQLGVAVDWIEVQSERSPAEVFLEAALWAVCLAAVLMVAGARLGNLWAAIFGAGLLASLVVRHLTYIPRGLSPALEAGMVGLAWLIAVALAPKERPAWGLVPAACGLWLVVAGRLLGEWQLDDAYISYRYAWNLVQGHGLVYNAGEAVEGYTNFLWTMLSAAALFLGLSPSAVTLAATVALSMALVGLTWRLGAELAGRRYIWPAVTCSLLAIDNLVLSYGPRGSGMEAMLFAVLVMLAAVLLFGTGREGRQNRPAYVVGGVVLALATLTRPEGVLVAALFIAIRTVQEWKGTERAGGLRGARLALLYSLMPYLAVLLPYEVWRILRYGYPLPNTFYAKTGASWALVQRGWEYFFWFAVDHWLLIAFGAAGIVLSLTQWRRRGMPAAMSSYVLVQTLYVVWVGGDHFPSHRFFVPVIAPLVLLSQEAARHGMQFVSSRRTPAVRSAAGALLVLAASVYAYNTLWLERPHGVVAEATRLHTAYVERWGSAGLWLEANTPPQTLIAAKGVGAIAYYSRRPTIDMFGLTDLHIGHLVVSNMGLKNAGHDKTDPRYVLDRRPVYVLSEWANYFDPVRDEFEEQYVPSTVRSPTGVPVEWLVRR